MTRFSVVTPTYNRRSIVPRAIDSSLAFARAVGDSEVIVIDDASQDGTADMIRSAYAQDLVSGTLKLVERQTNGGSTVAKSDGARRASGEWLIFLDSDDQLLPEASSSIPAFVATHSSAPVFFFRCVDQEGRPIGPPVPPRPLSFSDFVSDLPFFATPGECLPVISRLAFLEFPSDKDALGFELMSAIRILRKHGPAMLSDDIARIYHMDGSDRLTSRAGNLRRADQLVRGFSRMLHEFGPMMPLRQRMKIHLRIVCYGAVAACGFGRR